MPAAAPPSLSAVSVMHEGKVIELSDSSQDEVINLTKSRGTKVSIFIAISPLWNFICPTMGDKCGSDHAELPLFLWFLY